MEPVISVSAAGPAPAIPVEGTVATPTIGSVATAQVKWFDPLRGFGFLTMGEGTEDIFVHQRDLQANTRTLGNGETVSFTYTMENGKPKAKEVTNPNVALLQKGEHASLTNAQYAARLATDPTLKLGRVKWWDMKKGYGFITPTDNSQEVFVHQSEVQSTGFRALHEGSDVEYKSYVEFTDGKEQLKAKEVTAPGGLAVVPPNTNDTSLALNQMAALSAMGVLPVLQTGFSAALGRKTGTVKWYDEKKGYGFVITADAQEYFCHSSCITTVAGSEPVLQQGQIVEFSPEVKDGKPRTLNVTLPNGTPIANVSEQLGGLGKRKDTNFGFGYGGVDVAQQQLLQQQLLLQQQQLQQQQGYYGGEQYGGGSTSNTSQYGQYGQDSSTGASNTLGGSSNFGYPQNYNNTNFYQQQ